ncbi:MULTISPECIES: hypothetical protein [unclassified Paraburkholderia]|uniref:hypothetical protein n=1 Tax=unclassified Paraburkholderia TaxID=2615204 RepID=UPI002AAF45BD|nr:MULTISPECIES: hypothetical protein [unclassified Paraburkholderia]
MEKRQWLTYTFQAARDIPSRDVKLQNRGVASAVFFINEASSSVGAGKLKRRSQ